MEYDVIITAAGSGTRANLAYNKIFTPLNEKPCILYSVEVFLKDSDLHKLFITLQPEDEAEMKKILEDAALDMSKIFFVYGGRTRQESVYAALKHVTAYSVFIHDGARPFLDMEYIAALKKALKFDKAAILGIPAIDTLKDVAATKEINRTINRDKIYYAQTPQAFETSLITACHEQAEVEGFAATDDAQLVEVFGEDNSVQMVLGNKLNFKITTQEDIFLANLVARNKGGY